MYKIETHLHTSEGSPCGKLPAAEIVEFYHKAGFKTVFVTDHFVSRLIHSQGQGSWEEKMERYMLGYRNAKAAGDAFGMNILFAAEFQFADSKRHYLVYGIDQSFLNTYPNLDQLSLAEFMPIAKKHGLFMVQAHPFRDMTNTPTPEYVDGLEVINSNPRHLPYDELAEETAAQYHLYRTAGSDAHRPEDVGKAYMMSEKEICTVEEFIALVKSGAAVLVKEQEA